MLETILVTLVITLDQFSKYLTDKFLMPLGTSYPLLEGVFHLTSAHNRGAAFGLLQGGRWFFLLITVAACGLIIYLLVHYHKRLHAFARVCASLILAGAIGNLIDRVWLGYVRDMFDFCLINFAVFNVADSAITMGTLLLTLDILFGKGKNLYEQLELEAAARKASSVENTKAANKTEGNSLEESTVEDNNSDAIEQPQREDPPRGMEDKHDSK